MEKRLRSSLQNSADEFLISTIKIPLKSLKPSIKTLIHSINLNSDLSTSLPISLLSSISSAINFFKTPSNPKTPPSPPSKKPRKSSRNPVNSTTHDPENAHQKTLFHDLKIYAYIALICIKHPKKVFLAEDLFPAVRELHDNLILFESDTGLLTEISSLCEEWWKEELVGRELLISQFLPFLVSRSLTLRKKVDVHRVYVLREAFVLFDFEDESIEDLKLLLIRCVITPLYLKTDEGRRFIAFLFGLSPQLLKEVLAMIKSQIPFGRKSMLEAYGEILFRGWKSVDGDFRREIEDGFLQGLIEGATLAGSASFSASIRRVLGGFINQRTTDGVEKLLFRLAEPVIFRFLQDFALDSLRAKNKREDCNESEEVSWGVLFNNATMSSLVTQIVCHRSFGYCCNNGTYIFNHKVANSNVRQNALHLLLDLFPLEDPDATKEAKDTLLVKEFFLLEKLLKDDCPEVRVVAVEGCCRILRLFWEIIPSSTITKMLTIVFDDMAHDIANEVRLSTLNGIIYLMANPQAHEILKVLLPRLSMMISDPVQSVRVAISDLLLLIMDIRGFQFIKVVNLDILLSTLANDQPHVAQKITQLLLPSYFPSKVNVSEACSRVLTLIKRSPMAGARFCEFATLGVSSKSLMELVKVLIIEVLSPDKLDENHIKGIFAALGHLCMYLANESSRRETLTELFSGEKLKGLLRVASIGDSQSTLFNIISIVSPTGASGLLVECIDVVINCGGLPMDLEKQVEVRSAHKLVLTCKLFDNMFEAVSGLLQDTAIGCSNCFGTELPREIVPSSKRKKCKLSKMSGKVKSGDLNAALGFKDSYLIAVGIAWQIKDLLASEISRKAMFKSKPLKVVLQSLKIISEASIAHSLCCDFMDATFIDSYMALSLCLTFENAIVKDFDDDSNEDTETDSGSLSKGTAMDRALLHLLSCTEKVLNGGGLIKFGSMSSGCKLCSNRAVQIQRQKQSNSDADASGSDDEGSPFAYPKRMLNLVKICTAILKFIVDGATMNALSHNQQRCLSFTSAFLENMISVMKRCFNDELKFKDEQLREIHTCLKSSFSYSAKLINVVLASINEVSPTPQEVYEVSNHLVDLIASVELHCGSNYASRLVNLAKQWLPDVILGLGSRCILRVSLEENVSLHLSDDGEMRIHPWMTILANLELHQLRHTVSDEDEDERAENEGKFPAFRKLIGMMVQLLRINNEVLDRVGLVVLLGSATGLQRKEFGIVLGLLRFVFEKLLIHDNTRFGELNMMSAFIQELYPQVKSRIEEAENNGLEELLSIKALLEPVWLYSCETRDVE